jgi:enoyl-CoA hydratase/carnithine racemase
MPSAELLSELRKTIASLELDNSVRVVIMTGSREEFFPGRPWKST